MLAMLDITMSVGEPISPVIPLVNKPDEESNHPVASSYQPAGWAEYEATTNSHEEQY